MHQALQFRYRPVARPLDKIENVEHRRRPDDSAAMQLPRPQAAASAVQREVEAGATRAFHADALAPAANFRPVETASGDNQSDRRAEQEDRHRRGAPPCREMALDRRGEGDAPGHRRQGSDRGEPVAGAIRNPNDGRLSASSGERVRVRQRAASLLGGIDGDASPRAIHQSRPGEPLIGMGFENAPENLRRRRLRSGRQSGVEARRDQGRAHVDLASGLRQRKIALDQEAPHGHDGHEEDGDDDADRGGRGNPARAITRAAANRDAVPAPDRFTRASPRVCRACTRHRCSQTLPNEVGQTRRLARITTIRILVRIFVQPLDRGRMKIAGQGENAGARRHADAGQAPATSARTRSAATSRPPAAAPKESSKNNRIAGLGRGIP